MLSESPTPPMGWNTWNAFRCSGFDEKAVLRAADALLDSGMCDAGYRYVVIDDCWHAPHRIDDRLVPDPERFPAGIDHLADELRSRSLLLGLYLTAGRFTCAEFADGHGDGSGLGSLGHLVDDVHQFLDWGVRFIKWDWCRADRQGQRQPEACAAISEIIDHAIPPVVLSASEYGRSKPWEWAPGVATMWRTTYDLTPRWLHVLHNASRTEKVVATTRPGAYNDPDMLQVGNGSLTGVAGWSHLAIWAMLAAPLFAGNDVTTMSQETAHILTDPDLIALDQDRLVQAGRIVHRGGGFEVWRRKVVGGEAVLVVNLLPWPRTVKLGRWLDETQASLAVTHEGRGSPSRQLRLPGKGSVLLLTQPAA